MEVGNGMTSPTGSSHLNPAPVGVSVKTIVERGDAYSGAELCDVEITVLEVIRGEKAWESIKSQGIASKPPRAGFEYLLTHIRFAYSRRGIGFGDGTYMVSEGQFITVSADGITEYEVPSVVKQPENQLVELPMQSGETHEGWVLLQIPENVKEPLLAFKRQHTEAIYGVRGYVWFQLN